MATALIDNKLRDHDQVRRRCILLVNVWLPICIIACVAYEISWEVKCSDILVCATMIVTIDKSILL
jgi:hypothetical protein